MEQEQSDADTDGERSAESSDDTSSVGHGAVDAPPPPPQKTTQPPRQNAIFKYKPPAAGSSQPNKLMSKDDRRSSTTKAVTTGVSKTTQEMTTSSKAIKRPRIEPPSMTGYQGTARKPVATTLPSNVPRGNAPAPRLVEGHPAKAISNGPTKKGFAKKSGQVSQPVTNVFAGGQQRKPKQTYGDAIADTSKDPRAFKKARTLRRAELKSRSKEDQAPDPTALMFFPIGNVPQTKQTLRQNPSQADSIVDQSRMRKSPSGDLDAVGQRISAEPKSVLKSTGSVNDTESETAKGRRKSVRFTEEDEVEQPLFVDDAMEIDTPVAAPGLRSPPPLLASSAVPHPAKRKLSLAVYQSRKQSVGKKVVLANSLVPGSDRQKVTDFTFNGLPRENSDQPWLQSFLQTETLVIDYKCFLRTLSSQLEPLAANGNLHSLCEGTITSDTDNHLLEIVAEHLRSGLSGLYYAHDLFNIIIHPTKCDEFKTSILGIDTSSPDGTTVLKYLVFSSSTYNFAGLLRRCKSLSTPITSQEQEITTGKEREYLFQKFLGIRYYDLVAGSALGKEHHFYLVFPQLKFDALRSIGSWLQNCNPLCHIYTSYDVGSWASFREKSKSQSGTIIIEDSIVWLVRRIPSLAALLLDTTNYNTWSFSAVQPVLPHIDLRQPMFNRLFPQGKAILITPSFMVSEPQKTLEFFTWFFGRNSQSQFSFNKLVMAYGALDYLRDLSAEKTTNRNELRQTRWKGLSVVDEKLQENMGALTEDDIQARQRVYLIAYEYLASKVVLNGPYSEENPIIYADASIDPDDEQSLVNWFGWWSTMRIGQYRNFFVVGSKINGSPSSRGIDGQRIPSKASRVITIPRYSQSTVNDPNEALRAVTPQEPQNGLEQVVNPANSPTRSAGWFDSLTLGNNENRIVDLLDDLDKAYLKGHARLFKFPVSWTGLAMADHFGDHSNEFRRIRDWFGHAWPWLKDESRRFNTYIGCFHTIETLDFDPLAFPRGQKPRRHMWLAVYRPVNVHDKTTGYKQTELIIWDVKARDRIPNPDATRIAESDLIYMQRQLIDYVRQHGHEKNPGSNLQRVYLGGFKHPPSDSTLPVDITVEYLRRLAMDLKYTLPSAERYLFQSGFFPVHREKTPAGPRGFVASLKGAVAAGPGDPLIVDTAEDPPSGELAASERIIFHPPRGSGVDVQSRCTNHLFERARLAHLRNGNAKEMEFTFRSTMDWYGDQLAEDRGFQHINVDNWEVIFKLLNVKPPVSSSSNSRGKSAPSAVSSVSA